MSFTKIKHAKGQTVLEWEDSGPRQSVVHSLSSHDAPRPELLSALAALERFVLDICELPLTYGEDLTIQSVSLSAHDALGMGVVVTALKKLAAAQSPLVLNTPFVSETASAEGAPRLPRYMVDLIGTLELEAERFRQGERAQQALALDAPASTPRPGGPS